MTAVVTKPLRYAAQAQGRSHSCIQGVDHLQERRLLEKAGKSPARWAGRLATSLLKSGSPPAKPMQDRLHRAP